MLDSRGVSPRRRKGRFRFRAVVFLLSVLAAGAPLFPGKFNPLDKWGVSLTATEEFEYWRDEAAVQGLLNNYANFLELVFNKGDWTLGVEVNNANFFPANPEVPTEKINGIRKLYFEYRKPSYRFSLGDFYANFGKGLCVSVTRDEALLQDTTIFGGMGSFKLENYQFTMLSGVATNELTGEEDTIVAVEAILPKIKKFQPAIRYSYAQDYNKVVVDGRRDTATAGVTANSLWGFVDFNAELGILRHGEGNTRDGHAVYLGTNFYKGPWSMLVEYKDYFRFDNGFNNPPLADLEDQEAILGDIFGFFVRNNYNWAKMGMDLYGSFGYYTYWRAPKDIYQYFGGFIKPDLFGRLYLQGEYGQRRELDVTHRGLVNADLKLVGPYSAQFMVAGKTRISDLGTLSEWHLVAGFARASLIGVAYVNEFGTRSAIGRTNFQSLKVDVDVTASFRASAYYGSSRGGLICSGGVCRFEPPFKGTKLDFEYRF